MSFFRTKKLLLSSYLRLTHWEFWPPYLFYIPLGFYVFYLIIRYRSFTLFTSVNPAIPSSGVIGESKSDILNGLHQYPEHIAKFKLIQKGSIDQRKPQIDDFIKTLQQPFPVVLKPDIGERGNHVAIIKNDSELNNYLKQNQNLLIIQEYIEGHEFGIFYIRYPSKESGEIFSVTEKQFPFIIGNGSSTLEELILNDERAITMATFHLVQHKERLHWKPQKDEKISLVEIGNHCKGALFLDGYWVLTSAIEEKIDELSKSFQGFYFGRYDLRIPSMEEFQQSGKFKIVELNGVTSEATHVYDPKNSLWVAYRTLMKQWKIAFEIGQENKNRGIQPTPVLKLLQILFH